MGLILRLFQFTQSPGLRRIADTVLPIRVIISIHAVTWTATRSRIRSFTTATNFNSRSHVDCDVSFISLGMTATTISIHAVTWTATEDIRPDA